MVHFPIAVLPGDGHSVSTTAGLGSFSANANCESDINLCVGAAFAGVWFFYLPRSDPRPGVPIKERLREIDYVGTILITGAFVSGVMAINFGGSVCK